MRHIGIRIWDGGFRWQHHSAFNDDYNLMLGTGVADKNGIEIYEGDIIKHELGDLFVVHYHAPAFTISPTEKDKSSTNSNWKAAHEEWNDGPDVKNEYAAFEIVSNIYEDKTRMEEVEYDMIYQCGCRVKQSEVPNTNSFNLEQSFCAQHSRTPLP